MRHSSAGLTLIEVAVSATLVGLLVMFVITILPSSIQMFRAGREMTAAEDNLRSIGDSFRSRDFDGLSGGYDGQIDDPIARFSYHVDVAEIAGYGTPSRLKELSIRLSWTTRQKERELLRHIRLVNVPK